MEIINLENKPNNQILHELIIKQRNNISQNMRFSFNDLKRISKYLNTSIFNTTECCIWNGYISTIKNNKHNYINFFFNKKKFSLQRLLYINYVDNLYNNEYIKYNCNNKGSCCNINHIYKINDIQKSINNEQNNIEIIEKKYNENENIIVNFN